MHSTRLLIRLTKNLQSQCKSSRKWVNAEHFLLWARSLPVTARVIINPPPPLPPRPSSLVMITRLPRERKCGYPRNETLILPAIMNIRESAPGETEPQFLCRPHCYDNVINLGQLSRRSVVQVCLIRYVHEV